MSQPANPSLTDTPQSQPDAQTRQRKKALTVVAVLVIVGALGYLLWHALFGHTVSTDNAYVGADTAIITAMVSGQVTEVLVEDTQNVKQGEVLFRLDPRDAHIEVAQALANLAKARRNFTQSSASNQSLVAQVQVSTDAIASAQAQVQQAQIAAQKAEQDLKRRLQLAASGAISQEELQSMKIAAQSAKANLVSMQAALAQAQSARVAADQTRKASLALIDHSTIDNTPDVLAAQAALDQAKLDLERTVVRAPIDGVITKRSLQVGQRIGAGSSAMMIVPIAQVYVDANFKESQLQNVKVGQNATLTADLYGDDVVYHGKVVGFSGGTGAAFALIPAQNATGNWIKVVQRLPVRIALDPKELAAHPLRVGLSMTADIALAD